VSLTARAVSSAAAATGAAVEAAVCATAVVAVSTDDAAAFVAAAATSVTRATAVEAVCVTAAGACAAAVVAVATAAVADCAASATLFVAAPTGCVAAVDTRSAVVVAVDTAAGGGAVDAVVDAGVAVTVGVAVARGELTVCVAAPTVGVGAVVGAGAEWAATGSPSARAVGAVTAQTQVATNSALRIGRRPLTAFNRCAAMRMMLFLLFARHKRHTTTRPLRPTKHLAGPRTWVASAETNRTGSAMTKLRLAVAGTVAALAVAGCGDDNRGVATVTVTTTAPSASGAVPDGDAVLIVTRVTDVKNHVGEIREFLIGEARRCRGGKTSGGSDGAMITSTIRCPDGTLELRFAPTQFSLVQGAPWVIARATGSYKGLHGGGSMVAAFPNDDPDAIGREIFTGTVGR
jgi:hypothetical protein